MRPHTRVVCATLLMALALSSVSFADVATVQDQESKYKYKVPVTEAPLPKPATKDALTTDLSAGVTQGVDSNPLLDSTHKADGYIEETADLHFKYLLPENPLGPAAAKFGLNVLNVNYYRINDVNIFDGVVDSNLEVQVCKDLTMSAGYVFEAMWYPHSSSGNYLANEVNVSFRHKLTSWLYQKGTYRFIYRHYLERRIMLGNGNLDSPLRTDTRNVLRYELGMYIGDLIKLKGISEYYINESNFQFLDYYDYTSYKIGGSLIAALAPKLYGTTSFYYLRRRYDSRTLSDNNQSTQRDNLYMVTGSLIYDITKNLSAFVSYSHSENHTNEPLEQYVDTLYSGGVTYYF